MFLQGGIQMLSWLGLLFVTKFKQFDEDITFLFIALALSIDAIVWQLCVFKWVLKWPA